MHLLDCFLFLLEMHVCQQPIHIMVHLKNLLRLLIYVNVDRERCQEKSQNQRIEEATESKGEGEGEGEGTHINYIFVHFLECIKL